MSSPGYIKTGCFIIFHIDKRGREEKSGEYNERTTGDGEEGWNGAGGEGLTAINFAKIGAYTVAGRQSNPSSAHYPSYTEMRVQLDVGLSHEKRRAAGSNFYKSTVEIPVCTFCNYLPDSKLFFFQVIFSFFSSIRDVYRIRFPLEVNDLK